MFVLLMTMASHHALAQEVTITLSPGWNWVSYPRADTLTIAEGLASFTPTNGDIIKSQTGYVYYLEGFGWYGSFTHFIPGKGLMYRSMNPEQVSFVFGVEPANPTVPTGAINGLFTVNANGDQVYFSKGNLQYIGSAAIPFWKFADHQWDYLGDNGQGSNASSIDRDLFGWGTSGYEHRTDCYQPWSTSTNYTEYYAYGMYSCNLYDQTGMADWGYNAISNGGNMENIGWRTPTTNEWEYLFMTRNTTSGIRFVKGKVNDSNGVILLPDDWTASTYSLNNINNAEADFSGNIISSEEWVNIFEANGAVFLPTASRRNGTVVYDAGQGFYWSSSFCYSGYANYLYFSQSDVGPQNYNDISEGFSVRLVKVSDNTSYYNINVTPNPAESGTIIGAGTYAEDSTCTLTALANDGYTFDNWTENDEVVSEDATYSFTVTGNRNMVANFIPQGGAPIGAVNGLFTVNANGDQVYFSQGNLQYQASTNTWRFAESQQDIIGSANSNISPTYDGWIDLFGWGTSGYEDKHPWMTSEIETDYGDNQNNIAYTEYDWGQHNPISNGGNQAGLWRTLSSAEMSYMVYQRNNADNLYAMGLVNGWHGLILLPDDCVLPEGIAFTSAYKEFTNYVNNFSLEQWSQMEAAGAVFLPVAGLRQGTQVSQVDESGYYWSTDILNPDDGAHEMWFGRMFIYYNPGIGGSFSRHNGISVRLVQDAE